TILGTFLTRSGVVNSVHSFTQSAIGPLLLGYLVAILVLGVGLLLYRLDDLADHGSIGAPLSREAIFLFQNVLFVAATLTVLLGTLYPLIAEALSGAQLSIGAPYFDRVEVPIGLALLFLMCLGPQLPWHGASRAPLERQLPGRAHRYPRRRRAAARDDGRRPRDHRERRVAPPASAARAIPEQRASDRVTAARGRRARRHLHDPRGVRRSRRSMGDDPR